MIGSHLQESSLHSPINLLVAALCMHQNVLVEFQAGDVARQILQTFFSRGSHPFRTDCVCLLLGSLSFDNVEMLLMIV